MPPVGPRPAPPVGQAQVVFRGNINGSPWENVFWCTITGALTYANIATFATDMYGAYETNLLGHMSIDSVLTECLVTYHDGAGNPQGSASASHAGSDSTTLAPSSSACCISWKIPASWRGGKPRTYLGGLGMGTMNDQRLFTTTFVAAIETSAAAFLAAVNAITLTGVTQVRLGTVSFQHAGAWRTPPVAFEYVAVGVQQRICTQRRRLGSEVF